MTITEILKEFPQLNNFLSIVDENCPQFHSDELGNSFCGIITSNYVTNFYFWSEGKYYKIFNKEISYGKSKERLLNYIVNDAARKHNLYKGNLILIFFMFDKGKGDITHWEFCGEKVIDEHGTIKNGQFNDYVKMLLDKTYQ